jgi:hypothetical protein
MGDSGQTPAGKILSCDWLTWPVNLLLRAGVAKRIEGYSPQVRGPGLVYRVAVDAQREFLKLNDVANRSHAGPLVGADKAPHQFYQEQIAILSRELAEARYEIATRDWEAAFVRAPSPLIVASG